MSLERLYLASFLISSHRKHYYDLVKLVQEGRISTLETFFVSELGQMLDTYPEVKIFLDSGAFSLETQGIKNTQEYLDRYINFILKYKDRLSGYVNLDDVRDVEISWKNQKYMEERGVRPIPVYHHGEDFKWFEKYANEYDYVGIGGVARGVTGGNIRLLLDSAFTYIDKKGLSVKIHGFGVSSFRLLMGYPWYSVDSTTWLKYSIYRKVLIPGYNTKKQQLDFDTPFVAVRVSNVSLVKYSGRGEQHYTIIYPPEVVERIESYFRMIGIDSGKLKTDEMEREKANAYYYEQFFKSGVYHQKFSKHKGDETFF